MNSDRELLFGVLAVQLGFATPGQVMQAAAGWAADRSRGIAERLRESGALSGEQARLLTGMLDEAVRIHDGDEGRALDTLGGERAVRKTFQGSIHRTPAGEASYRSPGENRSETSSEDVLAVTGEHPGRYSFRAGGKASSGGTPESAEIGRGGIGRVMVAMDTHLGREVAVKELLPERVAAEKKTPDSPLKKTSDMLVRFLREARVTGQLEHPNIVPVYELGRREDGTLYYTMKLVRGKTFAEAAAECKGLRDRLRLLDHFKGLCHAVAYAHSRGVVHRDIKPENVMVGEFGETVVLDWGLARVAGRKDIRGRELMRTVAELQDTSKRTLAGEALGTPAYMSPEQAEGDLDRIDERSDVWSLGAVLYEILTGRPPYDGATAIEIVGKVLADAVIPVRQVEPLAPPELASVCEKALHRTRSDRYRGAKDLAQEVEAFTTGGRVLAYAYSPWEVFSRFVGRHRGAFIVGVASLVFLIVLGVVSYLQVAYERDRAQLAEKNARANLAEVLTEKAAGTTGVHEATILAAAALRHAERPDARGLLAGLVKRPRPRLLWQVRPGVQCSQVAFHPGNDWLACSTYHGGIRAWNIRDGEEKNIPAPDRHDFTNGISLAFSDDGESLALSTEAGKVEIREAGSWEVVRSFRPHERCKPVHVALTNHGDDLVTVCENGVLAWTGMKGLQDQQLIETTCKRILAVAFAARIPLATVVCDDDRVLSWKPSSGMGPTTVKVPGLEPRSVALSPNGGLLSIGGKKGEIFLYAIRDRQPELQWKAHEEEVVSLAFSSDGKLLASGGLSGAIQIWNASNGTKAFELKGHYGRVLSLAFSRDGHHLVSIGEDSTLRLWALDKRREVSRVSGHGSYGFSLAFSPDGSGLLTAGVNDGSIFLRETASGRVRIQFESRPVSYLDADFSPDGTTIATSRASGDVQLWDPTTGKDLVEWKAHQNYAWELAFTPHGERLFTIGNDNKILAWDVEKQKKYPETPPLMRFEAPVPISARLALSPDGRHLAVPGKDKAIYLWNLPERQPHAKLSGHTGQVSCLAFSDDSRYLASGGWDQSVRVWDVANAEPKSVFTGHEAEVQGLEFSHAGDMLATASSDHSVRLWSLRNNREIDRLPHGDKVERVVFSPGDEYLASTGWDGSVRLWDLAAMKTGHVLTGHTSRITSLRYAKGGSRLYSSGEDLMVFRWSLEDQRESKGHETGKETVLPGVLSPDGDLVALVHPPGTALTMRHVESGEEICHVDLSEPILSLAISDDGMQIAAVTEARRLHQVLLESCQAVPFAGATVKRPIVLAFSPDGRSLATGSVLDFGVDLWDIAERKKVYALQGHSHWVASAAFSPGGRHLATGSHDNTIRIWDIAERETVSVLKGHDNWVFELAYSPDGRFLASGSTDGTVRLWDQTRSREVMRLGGFADGLSLAFSPDGNELAMAHKDNSIRLLDLRVLGAPADEILERTSKESGLRLQGVQAVPDPERLKTRLEEVDAPR